MQIFKLLNRNQIFCRKQCECRKPTQGMVGTRKNKAALKFCSTIACILTGLGVPSCKNGVAAGAPNIKRYSVFWTGLSDKVRGTGGIPQTSKAPLKNDHVSNSCHQILQSQVLFCIVWLIVLLHFWSKSVAITNTQHLSFYVQFICIH